MFGVTAAKLNELMERGEVVTALIEFGHPTYFQGPIGFELMAAIAEADARRDHAKEQEPQAPVRSVLDY